MHPPQGYTLLDVITATAIIFVVCGAVVLALGPGRQVKEEYDVVRQDDVRDIAEAYFEFNYRESEFSSALLEETGTGRFLIGTGDSCAGAFGIQCPDATISDRCLDLSSNLTPEYLTELPIDPRENFASQDQSGYFFEWDGEKLTIGACNPEARSNIEISTRF